MDYGNLRLLFAPFLVPLIRRTKDIDAYSLSARFWARHRFVRKLHSLASFVHRTIALVEGKSSSKVYHYHLYCSTSLYLSLSFYSLRYIPPPPPAVPHNFLYREQSLPRATVTLHHLYVILAFRFRFEYRSLVEILCSVVAVFDKSNKLALSQVEDFPP